MKFQLVAAAAALIVAMVMTCRAQEDDEILSLKRSQSTMELLSPYDNAGHQDSRMIKRDSTLKEEKRDVANAANIALILTGHNDFRAKEGAANMNKLVYSNYLADMAQEWALGCDFSHGHPARSDAPWKWIGQNLYTVSVPKTNYTRAIIAWFNEKKDFTFSSVTCAPGKICGHYTQVVWWESDNVGCAATVCPVMKGTPFTNAGFIVCNYGPGGNYVGEKPYTPGAACSACAAGKTCENGLCA